MDQEYRDKFSRDEFRGQKERKQHKQYKKGRMAGDKVIPQASFMGDPSEEGKRYYTAGEDGTRTLQDIGKGSNPFKVDSLEDFDLAAYGRGAQRNKAIMNGKDLTGLQEMGGFSQDEIKDYVTENDIRVSKRAKRDLGLNMGNGGRNKPDEDETPVDSTPDTPPPSVDPKPVGPIIIKPGKPTENNQNQIVNQDNDITNNITGDGNTVTNTVDNSVSQNGMIDGNYAQRFANGLKDQYVLNLLGR